MSTRSVIVQVGANVAPLVAGMNAGSAAVGRLAAAERTLQTRQAATAASMAGTGRAARVASHGMGMAARSTASAAGSLAVLNPKLLGAGGLIYALKQTVGASVQFEHEFASVRKTVDGTDAELDAVAASVRRMSTEMPATTTELNAVASAAGQLGVSTQHLEGFTREMAMMGVATNMTSDEAAFAFARLANITQTPLDNIRELTSVSVALGNNFAAQESEIVNFAMRIAGAGTTVGMTTDQIFALSTALPAMGLRAEMGGSSVSRIMVEMASAVDSGSETLTEFARVSGMTVEQFQQSWRDDAAGTFLVFLEGLQQVGAQGESTFAIIDELGLSNIRTQDTLLRGASAAGVYADALGVASDEMESLTALEDEYATFASTTQSQWQILKNNISDVARSIGDELKPALDLALEDLNATFVPGSFGHTFFSGAFAGPAGIIQHYTNDLLDLVGLGPDVVAFGESAAASSDMTDMFVGSIDAAATVAPSADAATRSLGNSVSDAGDAAEEAKRQWDDYTDSIARLLSHYFDVEAAQDTLTGAYQRLSEQVKSAKEDKDAHATSLVGDSKAALANRDALRRIVIETANVVEAMAEQGRTAEEVSGYLGTQRQRLEEVARELGFSEQETRRFIDAIERIPSNPQVRIDVNYGDAFSIIDRIRGQLRLIPDTIVTRWRMEGRQVAGVTGRGGVTAGVYGADGMVLDSYAAGGIREQHVAQIAPAGAWRVWAEPETGGEAYIPLAPSKRGRSLAIWRETGRRLDAPGFYADGAVRSSVGGGYDTGALWSMTRAASFGPSWEHLAAIERMRDAYEEMTRQIERGEQAERRAELVARRRAAETAEERRDAAKALADHDRQVKLSDQRRAIEARIAAAEANARLKANRELYEFERMSVPQQLAWLDRRIAAETRYSDEWMRLVAQRRQIADAEVRDAQARHDQALADLNRMLDARRDALARHHDTVQAATERRTAELRQALSLGVGDDPWDWTAGSITAAAARQTADLQAWQDALTQARARGLSDVAIDALGLAAGPEALGQLRVLLRSADDELAALSDAVAAREAAIAAQVAREQRDVRTELGREIADSAGQLKDDLAAIGLTTGRTYAEAVAEGVAAGLPAFDAAVDAVRATARASAAAAAAAGGTSVAVPATVERAPRALGGVGITSAAQVRHLTPAGSSGSQVVVVETLPDRPFVLQLDDGTTLTGKLVEVADGRIAQHEDVRRRELASQIRGGRS